MYTELDSNPSEDIADFVVVFVTLAVVNLLAAGEAFVAFYPTLAPSQMITVAMVLGSLLWAILFLGVIMSGDSSAFVTFAVLTATAVSIVGIFVPSFSVPAQWLNAAIWVFITVGVDFLLSPFL